MGLLTPIKANRAYRLQQKGEKEAALKLYEEAFAEGLNDPRFNLAYALLIIRKGEYQKAKEFLVKHQKAPGMTTEQRVTLLVDYAVCCFRLGDVDKAINTLEQQFRKTETGLLYQTLGYLYVEKYDAAHRPDFSAVTDRAEEQPEALAAEGQPEEETGSTEARSEEKALSPEEAWQAGQDRAEEFVRQAVDYDDEDPICLDNLGQFLYRVKGEKAEAKKWFKKAYAIKNNQIDTLYFLSRYDEEEGNTAAALDKLETAASGRFSPLNYCDRETIDREIARLKGAD